MPSPFGKPDRCPLCLALLSADQSKPFGQTHCPRCQTPLWFLHFPTHGTRFAPRTAEPLDNLLLGWLGPDHKHLIHALLHPDTIHADSLDQVEMLLQPEEASPPMLD